MGRKSKYTIEQKVKVVQDYKSGKRGISQICHDLKLKQSGKDLYRWVSVYDEYGEIGLLPKRRNKTYSKELKRKLSRITYLEMALMKIL